MGDLSGAENVGGVSVSVSYDLGQLNVGAVQAKVTDQAKALGSAFAAAFNEQVAKALNVSAPKIAAGLPGAVGGPSPSSSGNAPVAAVMASAVTHAMVRGSVGAASSSGGVRVPISFDLAALRSQAVEVKSIAQAAMASVRAVGGIHSSGGLGIGTASGGVGASQYTEISAMRRSAGGGNPSASPEALARRAAAEATRRAAQDEIAHQHLLAQKAADEVAHRADMEARAMRGEFSRHIVRRPGTGGGRSSNMNPLSTRGLAAGLGSGLAAYGISEAISLASTFVEARNISAHPERILATYQDQSLASSAASDPFLRRQASKSADIGGRQKVLEGLESVPLLGNAISLADAMLDLTGSMKEEHAAIQRGVAAHNEATKYLEEGDLRNASRTGSKTLEVVASAQRRIDIAHRHMVDNPNDQTIQAAYNEAVSEGRGDIQRSVDAQAMGTTAIVRRGAAISLGATADRTQLGADRLKAFDAERETKRKDIYDEYAPGLRKTKELASKATSQIEEDNYTKAYTAQVNERNAKIVNLDKETVRDRGKIIRENAKEEREREAEINSIKANAEAERLRSTKQAFEAELKVVESAGKDRLAKVEDIEKNVGLRAAITAENKAKLDAIRTEHAEAKRHATTELNIRMAAAAYVLERMPGAANTMTAAQRLVEETRQAPPELKRQTAQAGLAEVKAMRQSLLIEGGTESLVLHGGDAIPMDPLAERHLKERKAQFTELNTATTQLESQYKNSAAGTGNVVGDKGDPAMDTENLKSIATSMLQFIQKFAPYAILN